MENKSKPNALKKIPKAKIEEGIKLSLKKSIEHLDGVNALIDKNLLNDSVALMEFAIEEFGRAVYLRERLQLGLETFGDSIQHGKKAHDLKYEKAFTVLPEDLKTIWKGFVPSAHTHLGNL